MTYLITYYYKKDLEQRHQRHKTMAVAIATANLLIAHGDYVIAFFDKNKEGYDMRTIGNRFFEDKDAWVVGKYALEFLNAIFQIEQDEEELK